jgi:phosphoserine phosphatase
MNPHTIIWDFDGTLYPLRPLDSEQALLKMRRAQLQTGLSRYGSLWIEGLIYGDRHQWFISRPSRKLYRMLYSWALKGTPATFMDRVAKDMAALISADDRNALHALQARRFRMLVVSCGTLQLCEKILERAGVKPCFEVIRANPLKLKAGCIAGGVSCLVSAEDKLSLARKLTGNNPKGVVAVGDGYTDIPLLNWVQKPIMMDPDHSKRSAYAGRPYHFISAISELPRLLT